MVQRKEMTSDFEKLIYDAAMLRDAWHKFQRTATMLVHGGWTSNDILSFIEWIKNSEYSSQLFPGSSMGTLLISKPRNGKLNYQQTLSISYDNQTRLFTMKYSDWDLIDSPEESEKAIQWTATCPGGDLNRNFIEFINQSNWRSL